MSYPLDFYTSHCQFYIYDKGATGNTGSASFWTNEAYEDRLAVEDGILGVGTECYGSVKAELQLLNDENKEINISDYDHIVEAGIEIKSGIIQILDCPTSEIHLEVIVDPGFYRARIYSSNLASVDGDDGDDFYKIEIWPDKNTDRKVLKRYSGT